MAVTVLLVHPRVCACVLLPVCARVAVWLLLLLLLCLCLCAPRAHR